MTNKHIVDGKVQDETIETNLVQDEIADFKNSRRHTKRYAKIVLITCSRHDSPKYSNSNCPNLCFDSF